MVYGLGDRGADLLAERYGIDRGNIIWKEKNKEVSQQYIQHWYDPLRAGHMVR